MWSLPLVFAVAAVGMGGRSAEAGYLSVSMTPYVCFIMWERVEKLTHQANAMWIFYRDVRTCMYAER